MPIANWMVYVARLPTSLLVERWSVATAATCFSVRPEYAHAKAMVEKSAVLQERSVNIVGRYRPTESPMPTLDPPTLMGIAALIGSLANLLVGVRTMMAPRPGTPRNDDNRAG